MGVGLFRARSQVGSAVLLVLVTAVLVRPWEAWDGLGQEQLPRSTWAYVVRAVDGDTIEVQVEGRREDVRYIGVDTPETVKPGTPVQCFGPRAHRFNAALVTHRRVRLEFDAERRDVYGRLLAYVHLGRRFVNAELVRRGLARTLTIPPDDSFAGRFKRLEMTAARAGRGLWRAC
ncbi:MAG: thermonuclease family protein [Solirubrobacterales bacterium]